MKPKSKTEQALEQLGASVKPCTKCKWIDERKWGYCTHPSALTGAVNPVDGSLRKEPCWVLRSALGAWCGPEGKCFELAAVEEKSAPSVEGIIDASSGISTGSFVAGMLTGAAITLFSFLFI